MVSKKLAAIIFFAILILAGFGFAEKALGAYVTSGNWTSTNLLSGKTVSSINSFVYNLSSLPANTTSTVQFSNDNSNWYDSSGNLNQWDTMSQGSHSIDLSALSWTTADFYYRVQFTSDGTNTPVLDDIKVKYCVSDSVDFVIDSFGNVGIGTTTPSVKLHVYESALDKSGALINIATTSASYYSLNVQSDGTSRLYVRADGNVGIGTAEPTGKLYVYDASTDAQPNSIRAYGTNTGTKWAGRIAAGGTNVAFIMGEYNSMAWLGAHNAAMTAWAPFYINPDGTQKLYLGAIGGYTGGPAMTINNADGNVGIGTTTPAVTLDVEGKLAMNDFIWDPITTTTELWLFDHEGNPALIIDATSSPIIWSQNLSSEFSQGSFEHTTTTNDKVYLEKDESGNYYSNGSFMTNSHDYQGTVEFLEMRNVAHRISASTTISAQVQVSDDNFSTIKDSTTLELSPDLQMHGISSLSNARYVRIKFDFQTQDSTLSPELIYFEVWANLIEESVSTTASSENTSSDLTVKENGSGQIVQIDVKAELVNLGLIVNEYGVLEVETLKAKKVVTDEFELRDKATGEIYCTWIENGEWVKIKGECSRLTQMINEAEPQNDGSSTSINDTEPEPKAEATTTEATTTEATTTEATTTEATSTEPVCEPTDEICDGLDNDCDGQIDEGDVCGSPTSTESSTTTDSTSSPQADETPTTTESIIEPEPETSTTTDSTATSISS